MLLTYLHVGRPTPLPPNQQARVKSMSFTISLDGIMFDASDLTFPKLITNIFYMYLQSNYCIYIFPLFLTH